jgi:hypothetical protein
MRDTYQADFSVNIYAKPPENTPKNTTKSVTLAKRNHITVVAALERARKSPHPV